MEQRGSGEVMVGQSMVTIRLDAKEIFDHVDDMLAWEAIASSSEHIRFYQPDFRRARPMVLLDRGVWGELTPTSLVAYDDDEVEVVRQSKRLVNFSEYCNDVLPRILDERGFASPVQYCRLAEQDPRKDFFLLESEHGARGDEVEDLRADRRALWKNVQYHLESWGELSRPERKQVIQACRLPQIARVFRHQHVLAFRDGRAASDLTMFAYWNRRFWTMSKQPLGMECEDGMVYAEQMSFAEACMELSLRDETWDVEISLGRFRTGIALATDATGALELANMLRGNDSTQGRRRTLVHWVDEHMRRRRATDADATVRVRAHFRGTNTIDAGRYHLRIWPATDRIAKASNGARYDLTDRAP